MENNLTLLKKNGGVKMYQKPVLVCTLLLCLGIILTFTVFWSSRVWFYIPLYNWGMVFITLWSIVLSLVFTYWIKNIEDNS